jgi:hypothetical protein
MYPLSKGHCNGRVICASCLSTCFISKTTEHVSVKFGNDGGPALAVVKFDFGLLVLCSSYFT